MILAGDIGGTNSRLGLFRNSLIGLSCVFQHKYLSQQATSLEAILQDFLNKIQQADIGSEYKRIDVASFGIAGLIKKHRDKSKYVKITNISHWPTVEEASLHKLTGTTNIVLVNDMEAISHGIELLSERDFFVLNAGRPLRFNDEAIIAAGTGLGEAVLHWSENCSGDHYFSVLPSEAGQVDFAPRNDEEIGLLRYLMRKYPRVTYERVLSGSGLLNIYKFLRNSGRYGIEPDWLKHKLAVAKINPKIDRRPEVIAEVGLTNTEALTSKALDMFVALYGAETGNIALRYLPASGIYIAGGIAHKIQQKLADGSFMRNFTAKGSKFTKMLAKVPIKIILNTDVGLNGAANLQKYAGLNIRMKE